MKFSKTITSLLFTLTLPGVSNAFVTFNNHHKPSTFTRTTITSSTTNASVDSSKTAESNLSEDFEAARQQTTSVVTTSLENSPLQAPLKYFIDEYFAACDKAAKAGAEGVTAKSTANNMVAILQYGLQYGLEDKYKFGCTHTALRGNPETEDGNTIDFYKAGCDFFRPAMDLKNSVVLGVENIEKAKAQIDNGENVVLFANHQSEADPQVMSCLLEMVGYTEEAEKMVYVAGHKVTTDTLAIPFSMGRNLICIHSKKHIDADPETKPLKSKQNLLAMNGMLGMLKKGGTMIWVAPSGGRDRRDLDTGKVPIAPFDQKTIDMFRLMGNKSKVNTHFYSVSMVSYDLCPPPDFVEAGVGEQRNVRFVPVGIAVSEELENIGGVESRHLFTEHAFDVCQKGYDELNEKLGMNEQ